MDGDSAQQAADKTNHRSQTCQIISNYLRREFQRTGRKLEVAAHKFWYLVARQLRTEVSRIEGPEAIQIPGRRVPIQESEKSKWAGSSVQFPELKWDYRNSNTAISMTDAVTLRDPKTTDKHKQFNSNPRLFWAYQGVTTMGCSPSNSAH